MSTAFVRILVAGSKTDPMIDRRRHVGFSLNYSETQYYKRNRMYTFTKYYIKT